MARGGMGAVWRARHIELDVDVALKFLRLDGELNDSAQARFKREARSQARLRSPYIVHIYDYGVDDGRAYIAMELLEGEDLGQSLERRGLIPPEQALSIVLDVAQALRLAHEEEIIHRDIKPGNIFLARQGEQTRVVLLDFGIAKQVSSENSDATTQGLIFGSPAYMSPEQARGGAVDGRSDLWSLAAVLFRMLSGVPPFEGNNSSDILVKVCTEDARKFSAVSSRASEEWDRFFKRALARDPMSRFVDVESFRRECLRLSPASASASASLEAGNVTTVSSGRATETAPLSPYSGENSKDSAKTSPPDGEAPPPARNLERTPTEPPKKSKRSGSITVLAIVALLGGGLFLSKAWLSNSKIDEPEGPSALPEKGSEAHRDTSQMHPVNTPASGEGSPNEVKPSSDPAKKEVVPVNQQKKDTRSPTRKTTATATVHTKEKKTALQPKPAPTSKSDPDGPASSEATDPVFGLPVVPPE